MAYCFMSTEKIKSVGAFTRKFEHNYRTANVPNADKSREHLNEELISLPSGTTSYADAFRKKMADIGHTPRSNAVLGVEIVMTYNATEVDEDFDMEKWKELNLKWLKENFPEEGILSVVMHRDEGIDNGKSAHLHAIVLPLYEDKLNCKHYLSGRKKLIDLQDSYGKAMEGVGLERGMKGSSAKHEDIRRFYDSLNQALAGKLPEPFEDEPVREYFARANKAFEDSNVKNFAEKKKMEREIAELKTQVKMAGYDVRVGMKKDADAAKKEREKAETEAKVLAERKAELDKREAELKNTESKLRNYNLLLEGLENHPDANFTESLGRDIKEMIEWQRGYEEQMAAIEHEETDRDTHAVDEVL